jgi:dienelactone hydrolase
MLSSTIKRRIVRALLGILPLIGQVQAQVNYDASPELLRAAYQRSDYYTQAQGSVWAASLDEFLQEAGRDVPVVVHVHGCYGLYMDDGLLRDFYIDQGANVVMMDFLKVKGRERSCELRPQPGGWPETSNPRRIEVRRAELESQVQWLKEQGFNRIFVSGHSEGGRTVQGLKSEVAGVFIHGMDCKSSRMRFWTPNSQNKIMLFLSSRDPWLDYPTSVIQGCSTIFNRSYVSDHWTNQPSHSPLVEQSWRDLIAGQIRR